MSSKAFSRLAPELHDSIFSHCSTSWLVNLAQASHLFYSLCNPCIYQTVDLSLHNDPLPPSTVPFSGIPINGDVENPTDEDFHSRRSSILTRQTLFFRTLATRPELGELVKDLTWTLICCVNVKTYAAFQTLTSLNTLDMGSLLLHPETITQPYPLFPTLTSIRFAGRFTSAFVTGILYSIDSTELTSLTLDNVLAFGHVSPPSVFPGLAPDPDPVDNDDSDAQPDPVDNDDSDAQPEPETLRAAIPLPGSTRGLRSGPMYSYLWPVSQYACGLPNLRHLTLRSVGQDDELGLHWDYVRESERYKEWAELIAHSRDSLEMLTIDQSPTAWRRQINLRHEWQCPYQQELRPMDDKFEKIVLPVLKEGFPRMRRLQVSGVGGAMAWGARSYVSGRGGWLEDWVGRVEGEVRGCVGGEEAIVVFEREGDCKMSVCNG